MFSETTVLSSVVVPATPPQGGQLYDLVALADVKEELMLDSGADDVWLRKVITRASDTIHKFCNRTFPQQIYYDRYFAPRDPYPWQVPTGLQPLQLTHYPLSEAPSLAGIAPPRAPVLSAASGGSLPAQRLYVRISYVTAQGETAASLESDLMCGASQLPAVASPSLDLNGLATGWNCYIGTKSFGGTLQNPTPLAIGTVFTLPASGLAAGAPVPSFPLVVENVQPATAPPLSITSVPLAEGNDYLADAHTAQLTRRFLDGMPRRWPCVPLTVIYQAGFATIPPDIEESCIDLVKARYFARRRDPMIKDENVAGVYSAAYWFGTGPGGPGDLPLSVADRLERYRVPVIA